MAQHYEDDLNIFSWSNDVALHFDDTLFEIMGQYVKFVFKIEKRTRFLVFAIFWGVAHLASLKVYMYYISFTSETSLRGIYPYYLGRRMLYRMETMLRKYYGDDKTGLYSQHRYVYLLLPTQVCIPATPNTGMYTCYSQHRYVYLLLPTQVCIPVSVFHNCNNFSGQLNLYSAKHNNSFCEHCRSR